jgi:hypothetical protein
MLIDCRDTHIIAALIVWGKKYFLRRQGTVEGASETGSIGNLATTFRARLCQACPE